MKGHFFSKNFYPFKNLYFSILHNIFSLKIPKTSILRVEILRVSCPIIEDILLLRGQKRPLLLTISWVNNLAIMAELYLLFPCERASRRRWSWGRVPTLFFAQPHFSYQKLTLITLFNAESLTTYFQSTLISSHTKKQKASLKQRSFWRLNKDLNLGPTD